MSDVTDILYEIERDPQAAEKLLPLVYAELRKLAEHKLVAEKPGQTLQATALVKNNLLEGDHISEGGGGGRMIRLFDELADREHLVSRA